ncbi:hypothetical protein GCM10029976_029200 [Kribbella albertanoniae]|uniref:Recombinase family protein n=1 Tax=Kribbella albertanoniae TaxID=1266829 RepID=A0A4R4P4X6_9ACTN|nr:hypothetical protein [Kribbella albertanoniae]TDC15112.1 hypothetical protein E1261_40935 [Kribbella albertanoniae]
MTIIHGEIMEIKKPTRPFVAIYLRELKPMTASEMAHATSFLMTRARRRGFNPDEVEIFVEKLETAPAAFQKMADKLTERGERVMMIPSIKDLDGLGSPPLAVIEALTADRVEVLITGPVT